MTNKEFIPYEEALALKELEFDEPCFDSYESRGLMGQKASNTTEWVKQNKDCCSAPLYQQAFRWFREKYSDIDFGFGKIHNGTHDYHYHIDLKWEYFQGTYEEAELACLRKLIEIVNQNKDD